jgi:hypothetical protein
MTERGFTLGHGAIDMSDIPGDRAVTGLRALWPRLTRAAVATLLVVVLAGVLLVRLLPPREQPQPAVAEQTPPAPQAAPPPTPAAPRLEPPPKITAKLVLPLLDNPPALPAPPSEPAKPPPEPPSSAKPIDAADKAELDLQVGDEFFQELVISRLSRYRILELDLGQNVQYVLVSRFRVKKKTEDGGAIVEQKVEGVRLSNADPALQGRLNELLQKTKGASFTMTLSARREVTKFEGGPEALNVLAGTNPLGGPSFLLWSFLDRDGWKELAEVSFFQPPRSVRRGDKWERPMTHTWGPLGNWNGKIHYQFSGKQAGLERFDYLLDLAYKPPRRRGGLPFAIGKSEFQIQTARGAIAYRPERGRVAAAEERFHVRGALAVTCLGVDSLVQMDEIQIFQLRILDRNPSDK